jgi:signal transduction histidine kinase
MRAWITGIWSLMERHGRGVAAACFGVAVMAVLVVMRRIGEERRRDRRVRRELEAYARLEGSLPAGGDIGAMGRRVCEVVAEVSVFCKVAMLARDGDGRMGVAGSVGVGDGVVAGLNRWAEGMQAGLAGRGGGLPKGVRVGTRSFGMEVGGVGVMVAPLWTAGGRMVGAWVVEGEAGEGMAPLEMLAVRLARMMENAALAERLLRSEKMASLGQLTGGVAHALSNPLTAVLGFAELIAETTEEARVQEDAETIVREALRMQETVQSLLDFWRPAMAVEEGVDVVGVLRELEGACVDTLAGRGVRLLVETSQRVPVVRGHRDRLRQVMEHLLNNAAQAIGVAGELEGGHAIRVGVTNDERGVQIFVSDTGLGFREPARVFDSFSMLRESGGGLGLSICYGIVKEHGGEISAFNLHPRGAAVVVELPVRVVVESGVLEVA